MKKRIIIQLLISSIIILLVASIITFFDYYHPRIINIYESLDRSLILRTIIQTIGLFLGLIFTGIVMKFNQLDGLIKGITEDLNSFLHNPYFRNHIFIQSRLNQIFNEYLDTHPLDELKKREILFNFNKLYDYRKYHKSWLLYPLYYSLITLLFMLILLIFQKTIYPYQGTYVFMFSICCLMSIWVVYVNISFVLDFLENSFMKQ